MKLKIEIAGRALCIEGEFEEVEALIERLLPHLVASQPTPDPSATSNQAPKSKAKTRQARQPAGESVIDAQEFANQLKTKAEFEVLWSRILNLPGQWSDKAKMIAYYAEGPITSGDVMRVMTALKVKSNLPAISKALSASASEYITNGTNPVTYELTVGAREKFKTLVQEHVSA